MKTPILRISPGRPRQWGGVALVAALMALAQPAGAMPDIEQVAYHLPRSAVGMASWYGGRHAGRRTASGEIHSTHLRTAAHRTLPLGTVVLVTNLKNAKAVVVRINDRGPYIGGRMIDLSEQAARDLAMLNDGIAQVRVEVMADE